MLVKNLMNGKYRSSLYTCQVKHTIRIELQEPLTEWHNKFGLCFFVELNKLSSRKREKLKETHRDR